MGLTCAAAAGAAAAGGASIATYLGGSWQAMVAAVCHVDGVLFVLLRVASSKGLFLSPARQAAYKASCIPVSRAVQCSACALSMVTLLPPLNGSMLGRSMYGCALLDAALQH